MHNILRTFAFLCMVSASAAASATGGYVYDSSGSVSVAVGNGPSRPVVKNEAVTSGTVIRTGDNSHAVLKFEDGEVVSMQANTTFQVRDYRYMPKREDQGSVLFSMYKGVMRFITGEIGQRNPAAFRLATPDATIRVRGTDFLVSILNNVTYSQVLAGTITVTNAAGMRVLSAGQTGLTRSSNTLTMLVNGGSVPADTFGPIASIPVPPAIPGAVPAPAPVPVVADTGLSTGAAGAAQAGGGTATAAETAAGATDSVAAEIVPSTTTAGGAAAGGAEASAGASATGTGISATTIGIGVGVAALIAAAAHSSSSTTHH